jgi:hypothetical protein
MERERTSSSFPSPSRTLDLSMRIYPTFSIPASDLSVPEVAGMSI